MTTPEFSLDWPHGWQTRDEDPSRTVIKYIGTTADDQPVFQFSDGLVEARFSDGTSALGECFDVINKPAPKREWWVNVYEGSDGTVFCGEIPQSTKSRADEMSRPMVGARKIRIACVKITEGDGL